MITDFACFTTEKIFKNEDYTLTKSERKKIGSIDIFKCHNRLIILNEIATEDELLLPFNSFLFYHNLKGTEDHTIDACSRKNKWRISFQWVSKKEGETKKVKLADTHK